MSAKTRPWFAVARDVFTHPDVRRGPLCDVAAWLHLVSLANHANNMIHSPPLLRGQLLTTSTKLRDAWGWERGAVRNALRRWERAGLIEVQPIKRASLVTITGYDSWQNDPRNQPQNATDFTGDKYPERAPSVPPTCPGYAPSGSSTNRAKVGDMPRTCPERAPSVPPTCPTSTGQLTKDNRHSTSEVVRYEVAQARDAGPVVDGVEDGEGREADAPDVEVAEDRIEGVGRTEDGRRLYVEFVRYGPGNPDSIRALKAASFTFDGMRWTGPRTDATRRLVARIHPTATRVCNLDDLTEAAEAERAARQTVPPSPPPSPPATLDVDCEHWRRVRDRMRRELGDEVFGQLFATFAGEVVDGVLRLVTGDEMAFHVANRPNYLGAWATVAQAELGAPVTVEVEHSNVVRLEDRRGA